MVKVFEPLEVAEGTSPEVKITVSEFISGRAGNKTSLLAFESSMALFGNTYKTDEEWLRLFDLYMSKPTGTDLSDWLTSNGGL